MREITIIFEKVRTTGMTNAETKELTERFKAMSKEEMELFMDIVPVEMCMARIQKELDRAKEFEKSIKTAMNSLG